MSDELTIAGKSYVSSKKAASSTGYAQDYIGQLARSGQIDAQRVGGLWYIFLESLEAYKTRTDDFKPQPPTAVPAQDPESVVSFDGKDYISANRAAKITGYNQDYIGQLARAGKVLSRQIGNRWYVDRAGLIAHKTEKDSLLAAVQREAVGLKSQERPETPQSPVSAAQAPVAPQVPLQSPITPRPVSSEPMLTYITESHDLMPSIKDKYAPEVVETQRIPISVHTAPTLPTMPEFKPKRSRFPVQTTIKSVSALTIVVVLSYSFASLGQNARFASAIGDMSTSVREKANVAAASDSFDQVVGALERILSRELVYKRAK